MHTMIRSYAGTGAKELFDLLERRRPEIEKLMRSVNGFEHYYLVRSGDGGITITFCQDEAGAAESAQKAREWIGQNASDIGASAPDIAQGTVIFEVK